jgi:hypothetical protein
LGNHSQKIKKKEKLKVDFKTITGPTRITGLEMWLFQSRKVSFSIRALLSTSRRGFYKEGNYVKWNNAYFHADAHLILDTTILE